MKIKLSIAALCMTASSAFAGHAAQEAAKSIVPLKDGGALYVFNDGKMAKEDRYGRAQSLKMNQVLETADGKAITVTSNEVALLNSLLMEGNSGN